MSEEILARGGFRLDRRRALEKMERFQLADPWAWVIELVAAAVAGGATAVTLESDADDLRVRWDGAMLTRAELDGLFDALFGTPRSPRERLLQHLAVGVLGALGREPRHVHVLRGPHAEAGEPSLRMIVDDPAETRAEDHPHPGVGTEVWVRLAVGLDVLGRVVTGLFTERPEARLVRRRAGWSPIPVLVNGRAVDPPIPERALVAGEELWLVPAPAGVDLVRGGITIGQIAAPFERFGVAGVHRDDTLTLDASRGAPVDDDALRAARRALDLRIAALLPALAGDPDAQLEAAAWLAGRKAPLGALTGARMVPTLNGERWSIDAIEAFTGPKGLLDDPSLVDASILAFDPQVVPRIQAIFPNLVDLSPVLRERREGQERRARAQANRLRPALGIPGERTFTEGPIVGAVAWRSAEEPTVEVMLRVGGAEVERLHVPSSAGPMVALLDHPGFAVDASWRHVVDDDARAAAFAVLEREALRFAAAEMNRATTGATAGPSPHRVLELALRDIGARARDDLAPILASSPTNPVLAAPAFVSGDGKWRTLAEVLAGTDWVLATELPVGCPRSLAARVLIVKNPGAWVGWLGTRARDGSATLAEEVRGELRRAVSPVQPRLPPAVSRRVALSADGWVGEIGLGDASWVLATTGACPGPGAPIAVLAAGIPVCTLPVNAGLERMIGVVSHPSAPVNRAHDGLTSGVEALTRAVGAAAGDLARMVWDADGPTEAVLRWLARGVPEWATNRPFARTVDGRAWTLAELRAHGEKRNVPRIKLITRDPAGIPGFGAAIVVTPTLRETLRALVPAAIRDGDEDLAGAERNLSTFLARPVAPAIPAFHERHEAIDDASVTWILPSDPERCGVLRVEARWRDRVLTSWERGTSLGACVVVMGGPVAPAASLSGLEDPNQLSRWSKQARTVFAGLVEAALDARGTHVPRPEAAGWRALLGRLDAAKDRSKAEDAVRARISALPLFRRLDGSWVARDAVPLAEARLVSPKTAPGPTDSPWYMLDEPGATALGPLPDGAQHLEEWRVGQRRREGADRREAKVTGALVVAPVRAEGLTGEVGLADGEGLRVTPLAEGVALEPLVLPFAAGAVAVVTGSAVQADRAFATWAPSPARDAAVTAILGAVRGLARTAAVGGEPLPWLCRWALADPAASQLPIFPTLAGRVAAASLLGRGVVGVVGEGTGPLVSGPAPVIAPEWMRRMLAEKVTVVDLAEVVARHRSRAKPSGLPGDVTEPDGRAAVRWGDGDVEVRREGVRLVSLAAGEQGAILPLVGWIEAEAEVDAGWRALVPADLAAVQARLAELGRRIVEGALDGGDPRAARRALFGVLPTGAKAEATLRARAGDPLVARLLSAPLFEDAAGERGSLEDLLAGTIHCVAPGTTGRTSTEDPRFWRIPAAEREALAALRPVVDGEELLVSCTRGAWRREAQREPPPTPESGALVVDLWEGTTPDPAVRGQLWLAGGGVVVRVAGCRVGPLRTAVPGLSGWVEGPFRTDPAFTEAKLPPRVEAALHTATLALLAREAEANPDRVLRRAAAAVTAAGSVEALLADAAGPWPVVPLLHDGKGAPLTFEDLRRIRKAGTFVVGPAGATLARKGVRLIVGGADVLSTLRAWFPESSVVSADELALQVDARKTEKEARKAEVGRAALQRRVLEAATRHYRAWIGQKPPKELGERVAAWAGAEPGGWPPLDSVEPDGPWPALLAFSLAAALPDPEQRKRACEGVAKVLGR